MRTVIIYHASCADGFLGATILWDYFLKTKSDIVTIPSHYGEPLPDDLKEDDEVYLVDFSYKNPIIADLCCKVKNVTVLDHHKTAQKELENLNIPNCNITFDLTKSGAMLAWEYCYPEIEPPDFVKYVQDRDLWKFELLFSREISAFLRSIDFNHQNWCQKLNPEWWKFNFNKYASDGMAILRFQEKQIQSAADKATFIKFPLGPPLYLRERAMIVNTTVNHSEVGEELCRRHEDIAFAVSWFYRSDGKYQYSLRSHGKFDVSEVAKAYGGGGHPNAAGFELEYLIR